MKLPLLKKLFLLTALLVLNLKAFTADYWIIQDSLTLNDTTINMDKNIIVRGNAQLVLYNVNLLYLQSPEDQDSWLIHVEPGGNFELYSSRLSSPDTINYTITIDSSDFTIEHSVIEGNDGGIYLNGVVGALINENDFSNSLTGFSLNNSHNCIFSNNEFYNHYRLYFLTNSWNNEFINNIYIKNDVDIMNAIIVVNRGSGNNIIKDNLFRLDNGVSSCPPIRVLGVRFPTLIENNVIDGFSHAFIVNRSSNIIISNNQISNLRANYHGGFHLFHCTDLKIYNNTITNSQTSFILYNCDNNELIGNRVEDSNYGIYLFHGSDSNSISSNEFIRNRQNAVFNDSYNNLISNNNFQAYQEPGENYTQIFDNGMNIWSGNYYSDFLSTGADTLGYYPVPDTMKDLAFLQSPISISNPDNPELITVEYDTCISENEEIIWFHKDTLIANETIYLEKGTDVYSSHMILENCTIIGKQFLSCISVSGTATLELNNCILTGEDMYTKVSVNANENSKLIMRDTKLINSAGWGAAVFLNSDSAIIDGCEIVGSVTGIRIENTSNHIIRNNLVSNCEIGIMEGGESNQFIIANNIFEYCSHSGILQGSSLSIYDSNKFVNTSVGIDLTGNENSFRNNTFDRCNIGIFKHWGRTNCVDNLFCNNNFMEYSNGLIPYQEYFLPNSTSIILAEGDEWDNNSKGNYWFDYLDKYPNAKPSLTNTNVWDIPYQLESIGEDMEFYDNFPLRNPNYTDTIILEPSVPILNMPIDESKADSNVTFSWFGCENATSYRLQLANDSTFSSPVLNIGNLSDTSYFFTESILEGIYYWRVLTSNMGFTSNWSDIWNFTSCESFLLTDTISICQGESYKDHTETGTYVENLQTIHGCDSIVTTILTVDSCTNPINRKTSGTSFNIYPNPVNNVLHFKGLPDNLDISIYSINGIKLKSVKTTSNHLQIDISEFKKGIYFIRLTTKDFTYFEKIIKE